MISAIRYSHSRSMAAICRSGVSLGSLSGNGDGCEMAAVRGPPNALHIIVGVLIGIGVIYYLLRLA